MNIRMPNISLSDQKAALLAMRSYLWQLAETLNCEMEEITRNEAGIRKAIEEAKPAADARAAFNSIKALIIKSADIVESYYETINLRLAGEYVAKSEFGAYKEETAAAIEATSRGITQIYEDLQEIAADLEGFGDQLLSVTATIRTGYLYTDERGIDRYGLEIGERVTEDGEEVFHKHARFTSDRLSFYDAGDTEIAYISDYTLHITQVEISGSLTIGRYRMESGDGLAFRWTE